MTRYLLAVTFEGGVVDTPIEEWKPEEIQAHLDYYGDLNRELRASGELVGGMLLIGPDLAKIVTSDGATAPVVTDGPFARGNHRPAHQPREGAHPRLQRDADVEYQRSAPLLR